MWILYGNVKEFRDALGSLGNSEVTEEDRRGSLEKTRNPQRTAPTQVASALSSRAERRFGEGRGNKRFRKVVLDS